MELSDLMCLSKEFMMITLLPALLLLANELVDLALL
jgi:hypothetical protein